MSISRKRTFILGLAVALVLPLSFYIIAKYLHKDRLDMPGYFVKDTDTAGKASPYHQVAEFIARNQMGDVVHLNADLLEKILVVNFMFTRCPSVCPRLTRAMLQLQKAYKPTPMRRNDTIMQLISITVDPDFDTVGALHAYSLHSGANPDHWWFLTAPKKDIYHYARHELHVASAEGEGDGGIDDFIHTQQIVLLDHNRHIRGYYDGLDSLAVERCANDISKLYIEKGIKQGK